MSRERKLFRAPPVLLVQPNIKWETWSRRELDAEAKRQGLRRYHTLRREDLVQVLRNEPIRLKRMRAAVVNTTRSSTRHDTADVEQRDVKSPPSLVLPQPVKVQTLSDEKVAPKAAQSLAPIQTVDMVALLKVDASQSNTDIASFKASRPLATKISWRSLAKQYTDWDAFYLKGRSLASYARDAKTGVARVIKFVSNSSNSCNTPQPIRTNDHCSEGILALYASKLADTYNVPHFVHVYATYEIPTMTWQKLSGRKQTKLLGVQSKAPHPRVSLHRAAAALGDFPVLVLVMDRLEPQHPGRLLQQVSVKVTHRMMLSLIWQTLVTLITLDTFGVIHGDLNVRNLFLTPTTVREYHYVMPSIADSKQKTRVINVRSVDLGSTVLKLIDFGQGYHVLKEKHTERALSCTSHEAQSAVRFVLANAHKIWSIHTTESIAALVPGHDVTTRIAVDAARIDKLLTAMEECNVQTLRDFLDNSLFDEYLV